MKRISFLIGLTLCFATVFAQQEEIHFKGHNLNNNQYIQLSKIEITNLSRNWTETLYYPDTTLILKVITGIDNQKDYSFGLKQNNPNPFIGTTEVTLEVAKAGKVTMTLTDILGRKVKTFSMTVNQPGNHAFRVHVASTGTYVLTARQNGKVSSIKMINQGIGHSDAIVYVGATANLSFECKNGSKGTIDKPFTYGDEMQFVGYAKVYDDEYTGKPVWKGDVNSETILLPISLNDLDFECGRSAMIDGDGNIYNTLLYDQQCWMKENMRVTRFPDGRIIDLNLDVDYETPSRYFPGDNEENVAEFGYLYNWVAVMNRKNSSSRVPSGVQGICPTGWHVPSKQEYDNLFEYIASVADYNCEGRSDTFPQPAIAKALCSTKGWRTYDKNPCCAGMNPENNNASGFSLVPAGFFTTTGAKSVGVSAYLWTTTANTTTWQDDAYCPFVDFGLSFMQDNSVFKYTAISLRCLRDY